MGFVFPIFLFILGMLAASNLIIARKPDAKEIIAKFAPYQGWLGVVAFFMGAYNIVWALGFLASHPVFGLTLLATSAVLVVLGLLLGVGTMKTFIKQPQAVEKLDQVVAKLAPLQGTVGLVALGLAVWGIVANVLFM